MLRSNPPSKDGDDAAARDRAAASTSQRDDERTVLFAGDGISADSPVPALPSQRFTLKSVLGKGGFGNVYLAYDEVLQRHVAVKTPCLGGLNEHELKQFVEEARTLARLVHPAIVSIYDVQITEDQNVSLIMEYLEGSSLQERIKRGPVPRDEAVALVIIVAEAVQHAHQQGFVHRDLKPSNILFDREGKPYVADFGLAVHESNQRKLTGEYSGTLPYMSPEQVRGETHHLDGRSDIWSIGVIIYELLAGCRPFKGETGDELRDEILNREPKPLRQVDASIPAKLERTCLKCLAKPISSRYNSASELADDLRKCLPADGAGIGAMPAPVSPWRQFMAQANVGRIGCGLTVTLASLLFVVAMIAPFRLKQQIARVETPDRSVGSKATGDDAPIPLVAAPDDPAPPDIPSDSSHGLAAIERIVPEDPDQRIEWQNNLPYTPKSGGDPITASADIKLQGDELNVLMRDVRFSNQQLANISNQVAFTDYAKNVQLGNDSARRNQLELELQQIIWREQRRVLRTNGLGRARRLAGEQLDRTTGKITWPAALQTAKYDALRDEIQVQFTKSGPSADAAKPMEIRQSVDKFGKSLRADIENLSREEYVVAQKFLYGLKLEATVETPDDAEPHGLPAKSGSLASGDNVPAPDDQKTVVVMAKLARLLATASSEHVRDGKRAVELATKVCTITEFKDPRLVETLAAAYAETGDYESAVRWAEKSLALVADGDPKLRDQLAQSLATFKAKQPLRAGIQPPQQDGPKESP